MTALQFTQNVLKCTERALWRPKAKCVDAMEKASMKKNLTKSRARPKTTKVRYLQNVLP